MIRVYIPLARILPGFSGAIILDATGWPVEVRPGKIDWVETWLCATAEWLGVDGDHHRVRFDDGTTAVVPPSPAWKHTPENSEPLRLPMSQTAA